MLITFLFLNYFTKTRYSRGIVLLLGTVVGLPTATPSFANSNLIETEAARPVNLRKVWYINMDSHAVRRGIVEKSLKGANGNVPFERHRAVQMRSLQECMDNAMVSPLIQKMSDFDARYPGFDWNKPNNHLSPTESFLLSVFLSHVTLYTKAIREFSPDERGYILVLEDDAVVTPQFANHLEDLVSAAPSDWQIIRVGTWGQFRYDDRLSPSSPFYRASPPYSAAVPGGPYGGEEIWYGGTHAVVLRLGTLSSVVDHLLHLRLNHVDAMETSFPYIKSYAVPNGPTSQEILSTTGRGEASSNPANNGGLAPEVWVENPSQNSEPAAEHSTITTNTPPATNEVSTSQEQGQGEAEVGGIVEQPMVVISQDSADGWVGTSHEENIPEATATTPAAVVETKATEAEHESVVVKVDKIPPAKERNPVAEEVVVSVSADQPPSPPSQLQPHPQVQAVSVSEDAAAWEVVGSSEYSEGHSEGGRSRVESTVVS